MDLDITLDRSSPVPLYHQVATAFEQAISSGELQPETMLDNEVSLAKRYSLSRPTMRQAMDRLVREGLVVRRRGVGTQVVGPSVRRNLKLSSLYNDLEEEGAHPQSRVLSLEIVQASSQITQQLGLDSGAQVQYLRRLRLVDGHPLALMENWLPRSLGTLDAAQLETDGMYNILRRHGVTFHMARQRVGAVAATAEQAELLGVETGAPLVLMQRTALDTSGTPVESGQHVYRADRYSFDITLVN